MATDFSENADRALDFAVDLAEKLNSSITIIYVLQNKIPFGMSGAEVAVVLGESYFASMKKMSEQKLVSVANNIKSSRPGLTISSIVKEGNPVNEIIDTAKNFDIIVIGLKGQSNFRESFTGTISERIVNRAKIPVLVIP